MKLTKKEEKVVISYWEKTPWWLTMLGFKAHRRRVAILDEFETLIPGKYVWEYDV